MEMVAYNGWERNVRLTDGRIELIVTRDVGPRIIRFGFQGERNVFAEIAGEQGGKGEPTWMLRGGHRLWLAPEDKQRTYEPDNEPVRAEETKRGVRMLQAPGPISGVAKTLDISFCADASEVTIVHSLRNAGDAPTQLAPWALSVMAPGGTAIIPLPERGLHEEKLTHAHEWSLWAYTDLSDSRWQIGAKFLLFKQDPSKGPNKLGMSHREGWVAYSLGEFLFVKRFVRIEEAQYPDGNVNFETYACREFLEIESLGPLVTLQPGASVSHEERWSLYRGIEPCETEADVENRVLPLLA